jgi:hypothetical protein
MWYDTRSLRFASDLPHIGLLFASTGLGVYIPFLRGIKCSLLFHGAKLQKKLHIYVHILKKNV